MRMEVNELAREDVHAREKLNELIMDIERKLSEPEDESLHSNLLGNVKKNISEFETEHPRATAILNDIMVTLSNMGI